MDDFDRASDLEEKHRERAIKYRKPVRKHDGYCLNCGEPSAGAYCDKDCKDEAELFERAKQRNGF